MNMAEKGDPGKTLTCESVTMVLKMVEEHSKLYTDFVMDNAKVHEGIISHCCHRDESVNKVSEFIGILEGLKEFMKSHVHVIDVADLIDEADLRANPGRRKRPSVQKPVVAVLPRDSGVGSTTSQDLKSKFAANSGLSTASTAHTDIICSLTERNSRSQRCTCDDNLDQQENAKCRSKQLTRNLGLNKTGQHTEDYSPLHEQSQTHPKTSYDTNSDTVQPKDDSGKKRDDNRKSCDS